MRKTDIVLIARFAKRKSVYTGDELKTSVVSFIAGYEIGTDLKCDFTNILTKYLEEKHQTPSQAAGWPQQIEDLSNRLQKDWITTFQETTLALLEEIIERDFKEEF